MNPAGITQAQWYVQNYPEGGSKIVYVLKINEVCFFHTQAWVLCPNFLIEGNFFYLFKTLGGAGKPPRPLPPPPMDTRLYRTQGQHRRLIPLRGHHSQYTIMFNHYTTIYIHVYGSKQQMKSKLLYVRTDNKSVCDDKPL